MRLDPSASRTAAGGFWKSASAVARTGGGASWIGLRALPFGIGLGQGPLRHPGLAAVMHRDGTMLTPTPWLLGNDVMAALSQRHRESASVASLRVVTINRNGVHVRPNTHLSRVEALAVSKSLVIALRPQVTITNHASGARSASPVRGSPGRGSHSGHACVQAEADRLRGA